MSKNGVKLTVASRATHAVNNRYGNFYKSYVKNVKVVNYRCYGNNWILSTTDYEFTYFDKKYIIREIVKGDATVSAARWYLLEEIE